MAKKKEEVESITMLRIEPVVTTVKITGDSDLVLHKMSDPSTRFLMNRSKNKAQDLEKTDDWEEIITSLHWRDGQPEEFSEESFAKALKENAPCIPAFAFKKSFGDAVVRNGIDTYKTKFDATMNVVAKNNLIPITFTEHYVKEMLMSPTKGHPILVTMNHFSGWTATFSISFLENVYSSEQIINIINLAGFGLGIGSSRSSGFGRYHVESVC